MRKILMMAVLAFLSLQGVGARASGISLLESGKKKLVAQGDTVKKDTVKKVTAYEKLLKDGGSECEGMFTVRHIKDNWYFEVPDTLLGRLLLSVAESAYHFPVVGEPCAERLEVDAAVQLYNVPYLVVLHGEILQEFAQRMVPESACLRILEIAEFLECPHIDAIFLDVY